MTSLTEIKTDYETKLNGKGSLKESAIFPMLISTGIYGSLFLLFVFVLPNIALQLLGLHQPISRFYPSLSLPVSMGLVLILMATAYYFYTQFMLIPMKTSTIKALREKYKKYPLILETMNRWIKDKGFLNYTDKETFRTYASLCDNLNKGSQKGHADLK